MIAARSGRSRSVRSGVQRGAALLVTLALVAIIVGLAVLWVANTGASEAHRLQENAKIMGLIRDALVARAATDSSRPGSLPCPDNDNDGTADGSLCTAPYLGRVPWKTLDLPDLRDAAGERFWYALSPRFRDHSSACNPIPCVLNSDSPADLTVNAVASVENVAIIFAPGEVVGSQNRDPAIAANLTNPANYLEGANVPTGVTDRDYQVALATDTFNDQALVITRDMLMPAVEKRVARQARACLEKFADTSGGRYPFAAPITDVTTYRDTSSVSGPPYAPTYYGRIPSALDSTSDALGSTYSWPVDDGQPGGAEFCFASTNWWNFWRELLLYHVASGFAPNGPGDCSALGSCLNVNGMGSVKYVVIVAGRTLASPAQVRALSFDKSTIANYLETAPSPTVNNAFGFQAPGASVGKRPIGVTAGAAAGTSFNDRVECAFVVEAPPCN
jgi:hypothetical protein